MIVLITILLSITVKPISEQPVILDGTTDIYASEFLFFTTSQGIYTFDRNTITWGRITTSNGLPGNTINVIGLDEGILWVATPFGLASADVRINDWRRYEEVQGSIEGLAFDDDYVYAGGDFGLYRYDKYIETWEIIDSMPVQHMMKAEEYLWCVQDTGIIRYDFSYEKLETIPGAPSGRFDYCIETPSALWFFSPSVFASFHKEKDGWSMYPGYEIQDYEIVGDSVFIISHDSLFLFEPRADAWVFYRDITGFPSVKGVGVYATTVLCATDTGLFLYEWKERRRESFTRTSGLQHDVLIDAYEDAQYRYVISNENIQYLNKITDIWEIEPIQQAGRYRPRVFYLDEAGGHARVVPGIDLKLQGRAYYTTTYSITDSVFSTDYENINMKIIGQHSSNRLISIYYDDTDKDQPMYGFGYRGLNRDLLFRGDGGYLCSEYYELDIFPQFSTLGGHAKLRYNNSVLNLQGGFLKSRVRKDFYFGTDFKKEGMLFDIHYQHNIFYSIHIPERSIRHGSDTVFVDDRQDSTNTIGTRINQMIGGISGDYDVLINGIDYIIDHECGFIQFFRPQADTNIVVLFLNGQDIVIQSDGVHDHDKENIYLLGPDIVPGSCSLSIVDTLGQQYPLNTWNLDPDGDGQVDPTYLNHDLGYLEFPQNRPFPNAVYDDTLHIYTIHYTLYSSTPFYYLSHKPIAFGSERVYVDGDLVSPGLHYIMDYTSGILLFIQEDLITDFSEIEVEYSSVERENEDTYYSVQPIVRINDHIDLAPGFTQIVDEQFMHLSGRLEYGSDDGIKVKYTPQAALSTDSACAQHHDLITRYKFVGLTGHFSTYSDEFEGFGSRKKKYGTIANKGAISAHLDMHRHITFDGAYSREQQRDSLSRSMILQHASGKINYLNPTLPMWSLLYARDILPDYAKSRMRAHANYDFSLLLPRVKLSMTVINTQIQFSDELHGHYALEYILHSGFVFPVPISANIYYRRNQVSYYQTKQTQLSEIIGSLNIDVIPGLYYSGNYLLETNQYFLNSSQEAALQYYFYNNLHIAPGRWLAPLSVINLACGLGKNFDEYIRHLDTGYKIPPYLLSHLETGSLSSLNLTDSYYGLIQLTPWADLLIWNKYSVSMNGQSYYENPELQNTIRNLLRIEYEPFSLGLFTFLWDYKEIVSYPVITTYNFYGEWNKPWTPVLRTKVSTNYRTNKDDYILTTSDDSELRTNIETLLRFNPKSYITINVGGSRQEIDLDHAKYLFTPGAGININLLRFLYVQCDYTLTHIIDSTTTHQISAKLTGKF